LTRAYPSAAYAAFSSLLFEAKSVLNIVILSTYSPISNPFDLGVVFNKVLGKLLSHPIKALYKRRAHEESKVEVAWYTKYLLQRMMSIYKGRATISTYCNTKLNETLNEILAHEDKLALLLVDGSELGLKSVDLGLEGCYRVLGHGSCVARYERSR
jgi:hypothetical protein